MSPVVERALDSQGIVDRKRHAAAGFSTKPALTLANLLGGMDGKRDRCHSCDLLRHKLGGPSLEVGNGVGVFGLEHIEIPHRLDRALPLPPALLARFRYTADATSPLRLPMGSYNRLRIFVQGIFIKNRQKMVPELGLQLNNP